MTGRQENLARMLRGYLDGSIKPENGKKISFVSLEAAESDEKQSEQKAPEERPASGRPFIEAEKEKCQKSPKCAPNYKSSGSPRTRKCPESLRNAFAVLGLSEEADFQTSRKVYLTLLKQCHPDKKREDNAEYAQKRTAALNSAWETIQNYFKNLQA
ncbi:MAG: J domain-containing protein [Treponemataceae bacterium]|nr:J domain-containing protein [Treponemataceae bacterium]